MDLLTTHLTEVNQDHNIYCNVTVCNTLSEMNDLMSQMRHTAHDLRSVLDQARQGTDGTSQSSEGEFFPCVIGQSEPVAEVMSLYNTSQSFSGPKYTSSPTPG